MSISSRVTVGGVALDGYSTLDVSIQTRSAGGAATLRMADGGLVKQTAWQKLEVTLTCAGWVPPALGAVDFTSEITIIVPAEAGTVSYTGFADIPQQNNSAGQEVDCSWTLTLLES